MDTTGWVQIGIIDSITQKGGKSHREYTLYFAPEASAYYVEEFWEYETGYSGSEKTTHHRGEDFMAAHPGYQAKYQELIASSHGPPHAAT